MTPQERQNIERIQIFERGRRDHAAGVPQAKCPYRPGGDDKNKDRRVAWLDGWHKGIEPGTRLEDQGGADRIGTPTAPW